MSDETIRNAFRIVQNEGMKSYAFNMVGLPEETLADLRATIALNRQIMPDAMQVSIFQPYPGTKLREIALQHGWISSEKLPRSHKSYSIMKYPTWSAWRIRVSKLGFRFFCLWPNQPGKAIVALSADILADYYNLIRGVFPPALKRYLYRIHVRVEKN